MARVQVDADLNLSTRKADRRIQESAKKAQQAFSALSQAGGGMNVSSAEQSFKKLSQPLGRITGQAAEFEKSLEASNARVLAFGASVVVINKLNQTFAALVENTIKVEKTFKEINVILGGTQQELEQFGKGIFDVARNTANSFETVAEGALELARQGLNVEETLSRVSTALKLVRVSGVDSEKAVAGLTAAVKGFTNEGLKVAEIADKIAEVDTKFAVSTEDIINGIERSAASARAAGVSFDELISLVTVLQERTQRGGNIIGNAFKTIFARVQSTQTLDTFRGLGIEVEKSNGQLRDAIPLFEDLADKLNVIGLQTEEAQEIIQKVSGVRQRDILINLIEDLNSAQSQFSKGLLVSADAVGALDKKNEELNKTFDALINKIVITGQQLSSLVGELGFGDAARMLLKGFGASLQKITDMLQGESMGSDFAKAFVAGVGNVLVTGGLPIIISVFIKLFYDLSRFAVSSLKDILNLNSAAKQQEAVQKSIFNALAQNEILQQKIFQLGDDRLAQEQLLLKVYNQQSQAVGKLQKTAAALTPGIVGAGVAIDPQTGSPTVGSTRRRGRAAGGYIAEERRDISKGVGGASPSSSVVSIPNFAFGSGQRGTMIANSSEYYVPNFQGGADAIFNPEMAASMGLPKNAKKLGASKGYVPNFSKSFLELMKMAQNRSRGLEAAKSSSLRKGIISKEQDNEIIKTSEQAKSGGLAPSLAARKQSQKARKEDIASAIFDIDKRGATMLVPQSFPGAININRRFSAASRKKYGGYSGVTGFYYGISPNLKSDKKYAQLIGMDKELDDAIYDTTKNALVKLSPSIKAGDASRKEIDRKFRQEGGQGAFGAFKGAIFETIISSIAGASAKDKANTLDVRFDTAQQRQMLERIFGLPANKYKMADYKSSGSDDNIDSFARQVIKNLLPKEGARKVTRRASEGYIPNFAQSPLEDAISRERAAGLPINQIRVNQDSKLKNSSNPMGLAVTNTRDEPTGRIPNFAKKLGDFSLEELTAKLRREEEKGRGKGIQAKGLRRAIKEETDARKAATKATRASGSTFKSYTNRIEGNIGKLFLLQTASLGLSGAMGSLTEDAEGFEAYMGRSVNQLQSFIATLITLNLIGLNTSKGFGQMGESLGKFKKNLSTSFNIGKSGRPVGGIVGSQVAKGGLGNIKTGKVSYGGAAIGMANKQIKQSRLSLMKTINPMAAGFGRVAGSLGKLVPFIGPVILGFQGLNSILKIFTGESIFEKVTSALGSNTKSLEENKKAIIEEYKARMDNIDSINNFFEYQERATQLQETRTKKEDLESGRRRDLLIAQEIVKNLSSGEFQKMALGVRQGNLEEMIIGSGFFGGSEVKFGEVATEALGPENYFATSENLIAAIDKLFKELSEKGLRGNQGIFQDYVSEQLSLVSTEIESLAQLQEKLENEIGKAGGIKVGTTIEVDVVEVVSDIRKTLQKGLFNEEDMRLSKEFALQLKSARTESESLQTFYDRQLESIKSINEAEEKRSEALFNAKSDTLKILEDQVVIDEAAAQAIKERFVQTNDINELYQSLINNSEKIFETDNKIQQKIREIIASLEEEEQQIQRNLDLARQRAAIDIDIKIQESKRKVEEFNRELMDLQAGVFDIDVSNFRSIAVELEKSVGSLKELDKEAEKLSNRELMTGGEGYRFSGGRNYGSTSMFPKVERVERENLTEEELKLNKQLTDQEKNRLDLLMARLNTQEKSLEQQLLELQLQKQGLSDEEISLRLNEGKEKEIRRQINTIIERNDLEKDVEKAYKRILSILVETNQIKNEQLEGEIQLQEKLRKIENERLETNLRFEKTAAMRQLQRATISRSRSLTPQEQFQSERRGFIAEEQERISDLRSQLSEARARLQNAGEKNDEEAQRVQNLERELKSAEEIYAIRLKTFDVENKPRTGLQKYVKETEDRLARISDELPRTMAENLESGLADAFTNIATGAYDSIGDAFLNIALNFGQALQEEITRASAANIVSGITNSAAGSNAFQSIGNAVQGAFTGGGRTTTTPTRTLGGTGGTDRFYAQAGPFGGYATGGYVTGGSGVKDDVPAKLTGGEYVVRKSAVQKYGLGFLENLNNRNIQKYQAGGLFIPGTRGKGAISGLDNLLNFSKQSITSGSTDLIKRRRSGISSYLEPQSMRLSNRGRFVTPSGQRKELKSAQQSAFNVRGQQIQENLRVEEQNRVGLQRVREANEAAYQRYLDRYMAEYNRALRQYNAEWDAREDQLRQGILNSFVSAGFNAIGAGFGGGGGSPTATGGFPSSPTTPGQPMQFNRGAGGVPTGGFDIQTSSGLPVGAIAANGGMMSNTNALLMDGEYVMSPETVGRVGKDYLEDINNMRAPMTMANGGSYGSAVGEMSSERKADVGAINININVEKGGDTSSDEDSNEDDDPQKTKEFSKKVRQVVLKVIQEEKRVSGSLFTRNNKK